MSPHSLAWFGAASGILGGVLGTYYGIKNTTGARERAFLIRSAVVCWVLVIAFGAGMWLIPSPQRYWLWLPYAILLPLAILYCNRRQGQIRREESSQRG